MLPVVTAVAVLALTVCLLNLLLTLGVIRRLRQHTDLIARLSSGPHLMLSEGQTVPHFQATSTSGEPLSRELLAGRTLFGVFAPDCTACGERLPAFLDAAGQFPGGRGQVVAVVVGLPEEARPYVERLQPVARVVVEPEPLEPGGVGAALGIGGFPAFAVVDSDGTVLQSGLPSRPALAAT